MLHSQQECRRIPKSGAYLFGLVDQQLYAVGQLTATVGELIGAVLQGRQTPLHAAGVRSG